MDEGDKLANTKAVVYPIRGRFGHPETLFGGLAAMGMPLYLEEETLYFGTAKKLRGDLFRLRILEIMDFTQYMDPGAVRECYEKKGMNCRLFVRQNRSRHFGPVIQLLMAADAVALPWKNNAISAVMVRSGRKIHYLEFDFVKSVPMPPSFSGKRMDQMLCML